jgi:hypothetical protein
MCNDANIFMRNEIFVTTDDSFCFIWSEKKVFPSFRSEAKITNLKRSEKLEANRSEKKGKT